jgi:hypothetical protein
MHQWELPHQDTHPKDTHLKDMHLKDTHPQDMHLRDPHPQDMHPKDMQPTDLHLKAVLREAWRGRVGQYDINRPTRHSTYCVRSCEIFIFTDQWIRIENLSFPIKNF